MSRAGVWQPWVAGATPGLVVWEKWGGSDDFNVSLKMDNRPEEQLPTPISITTSAPGEGVKGLERCSALSS